MMTAQLQGQQQMRYDLDQLKDLTQGVQDGLASSIGQVQQTQQVQQQEQEFMMSRATLGRPAMVPQLATTTFDGGQNVGDTLNSRSM